jgi:hypothetical protein
MDKDQAKLILACRRPGGLDDQDPAIREALEAARRDPELSAWLEAEQALDGAISARLRSVPIPHALRSELLAGGKITRVSAWWQQPRVWSLAAGLVLLLGLGVTFVRDVRLTPTPALVAATFEDLRRDVSGLTRQGFEPQAPVSGLDQARQWLVQRSAPDVGELPPFLADAITHACSVIEWRGRNVAGICLVKDGQNMHLFVLPKSVLEALPRDGEILNAQVNDLSTLAWNSPNLVYVLVGDTPQTDLSRLLQSP